jgi:hypothetical protein
MEVLSCKFGREPEAWYEYPGNISSTCRTHQNTRDIGGTGDHRYCELINKSEKGETQVEIKEIKLCPKCKKPVHEIVASTNGFLLAVRFREETRVLKTTILTNRTVLCKHGFCRNCGNSWDELENTLHDHCPGTSRIP